MSNRILYDQTFNASKMLAQAVHKALDARLSMLRVQAMLDRMQYGAPADWASVAAELGLVTQGTYTAVQQAQDLYGVFSAAMAQLDHDAVRVELARLDQG